MRGNRRVFLLDVDICDVLRNLVPRVQFKKRENTHGGVLLSVKLQAFSCYWLLLLVKL